MATFLTPLGDAAAIASQPVATDLGHLPLHARALVTGLQPGSDAQERAMVLRLLEIGFLPGEMVSVLARGGLGGDPMAVRVGQATFALRRREAAMVQVQELVKEALP